MTNSVTLLLWILCILALPIVILLVVVRISEFTQELRYLNTEIHRTSGEQRRHWLRRRRRLWLSLIPFIRY